MSTARAQSRQERELLDAARGGDEGAYTRLVEPFRSELQAHCYRMLGSPHDAEDAVQDALLRAWRGLPRFEGRSSPRSWLYRIATNTCIDAIKRRPARMLAIDHGPAFGLDEGLGAPLVESVWIEPYPDGRLGVQDGPAAPDARYEQRESVELAFVAALQQLPARQRAALILRDVLGFSAEETAESLEASVPSVNSALQRARRAMEERTPEQSQQATLRALGDEGIREVVERYMDAMERGDVDAMVAMLAQDAAWSMPPLPAWFRGRDGVAGFLRQYAFTVRWKHLPTRANGQLAFGCYAWDRHRDLYVASVLDVLTLRGGRILEVTGFATPAVFARLERQDGPLVPSPVFRRFGLPEELST
jgi:RNA polymerase sigma-70 factor (ECF subfamily)